MDKKPTKPLFKAIMLYAIAASLTWVCLGQADLRPEGAIRETQGDELLRRLLPLDSAAEAALDQLIQTAMAGNPEIQSLRERVSQARGLHLQSSLRPNPTLELAAETDAEAAGSADRGVSVGYSHIFETGGKRRRRMEVAQQEITIAEYQLAESRRNLAAELRTSYLQAIILSRTITTQQELAGITLALVDIVDRRVQQGETAAIQLTQARVENSRVVAELTMLESRRRAVLAAIRTLAGLEPGSPVRIEGQVQARKLTIPSESLASLALSVRPDLNAVRTQVRRVEAEIELLKTQQTPDVTGSFRYSFSRSAFDLSGLDAQGRPVPIRELDHGIGAELTFEIPVRDRNQGRIAAATAELRAFQLEVRSLEAAIRQEIAVASERYDAAFDSLNILQSEVLQGTRASLNTLRDAYQLGEIPFSEVLNEQRRLVELQTAYNDVLLEYAGAAADLAKATAVQTQ